MADERVWRYVGKSEVTKLEKRGWVDTGESPEHHGNYSHVMYRYLEEEKPPKGDLRVKTSTARTEAGEVVLSFVTENGFSTYRISADNLASHIGRCVRAMSDLVK